MVKKHRISLTISARTAAILEDLEKKSGKSKSNLVEFALDKQFRGTLRMLKEQKRELLIQINELDARIRHVESEQENRNN